MRRRKAFTRKRTFKKKRSFTAKRRHTTKKRKFTFKRSRLSRVVSVKRHHRLAGRNLDRDHLIFEQRFEGLAAWDVKPQVSLATLGGRSDGFLISLNALVNALPTRVTLGGNDTQYDGPPPVVNLQGGGMAFSEMAASGTRTPTGFYQAPDGFSTSQLRFQNHVVTGGVVELLVSMDSGAGIGGAGANNGSTRVSLCAFPSSGTTTSASDFLVYTGAGHWIYPWSSGVTASTVNSDSQSFNNLQAERNVKTATLSGFAGSRTFARIKYPFSIAKYSPPGYIFDPDHWQVAPPNYSTLVSTTNPPLLHQPRLLVQLHNDGTQSAVTYRFEIKIKWFVTAFERWPALIVQ